MTPPTIADAKALATKCRSRGVLVLALDGNEFAVVSYGWNRDTCDALRKVNEQIGDLIAEGKIVIPDALRVQA